MPPCSTAAAKHHHHRKFSHQPPPETRPPSNSNTLIGSRMQTSGSSNSATNLLIALDRQQPRLFLIEDSSPESQMGSESHFSGLYIPLLLRETASPMVDYWL